MLYMSAVEAKARELYQFTAKRQGEQQKSTVGERTTKKKEVGYIMCFAY